MKVLQTSTLITMILSVVAACWLLANFNHGPLWVTIAVSVLISSLAAIIAHFCQHPSANLFASIALTALSTHFVLSIWFNGFELIRTVVLLGCVYNAWIELQIWRIIPKTEHKQQ